MEKQHYELTYIVSIKHLDQELQKVIDQVTKMIKDNGGEITKDNIIGRQKLAYPIKQVFQGTYVAVEFDMAGTGMKKLDSDLKLMNEILRHLIIKKRVKSEAEIKREADLQERLRKEKADELKQLEEETKTAVKKSETAPSLEVDDKRKSTDKQKDDKVSLDDLDKKLDEILKDDII